MVICLLHSKRRKVHSGRIFCCCFVRRWQRKGRKKKKKLLYASSKRFQEHNIFRASFAFEITDEVRVWRKGANIKSSFHLNPNNYFPPKFLSIAYALLNPAGSKSVLIHGRACFFSGNSEWASHAITGSHSVLYDNTTFTLWTQCGRGRPASCPLWRSPNHSRHWPLGDVHSSMETLRPWTCGMLPTWASEHPGNRNGRQAGLPFRTPGKSCLSTQWKRKFESVFLLCKHAIRDREHEKNTP